jgi:hypothetical protein
MISKFIAAFVFLPTRVLGLASTHDADQRCGVDCGQADIVALVRLHPGNHP